MSHTMLRTTDESNDLRPRSVTNDEYADEEDDSEDDAGGLEKAEKDYAYEPEPPQEGIYGMAVASIIIDYRNFLLAKNDFPRQSRYGCRFCLAMFLTICTISLQVYLTAMTKLIVTPSAVRELRMSYGDYQIVMYDNHTYITENGHHRGIGGPSGGFFNISRYNLMDEEKMHEMCTCPLAQPMFLSAILLVWTVTCLAYMRETVQFALRLINLNQLIP